MPERNFSSGNYRYGFNGKENDNEVKGDGNQQDYGMRIYDPRLGKFLSVDPLFQDFPWNSVYAFAENDVIRSIDLDGGEKKIVIIHQFYDEMNKTVHTYQDVDENANNKYKLGSGVLTIIKRARQAEVDPVTGDTQVYSGTSTAVYRPGGVLEAISRFLGNYKFGVVVFGKNTDPNAFMGGNVGDDIKVIGVINLNDKDSKEMFEILDLIGASYDQGLHDKLQIELSEFTERAVELTDKAVNTYLDKQEKLEEQKQNEQEKGQGKPKPVKDTLHAPPSGVKRSGGKVIQYDESKTVTIPGKAGTPDTVRTTKYKPPKN